MGMDVLGKAPTAAVGRYFSANPSGWSFLWTFCCGVSASTQRVKLGFSNDGDGLDAEGARCLATDLRAAVADGRLAEFERHRCPNPGRARAEMESALTVMFAHVPEVGRAVITSLLGPSTSMNDYVLRFANFLECSGGFEIW